MWGGWCRVPVHVWCGEGGVMYMCSVGGWYASHHMFGVGRLVSCTCTSMVWVGRLVIGVGRLVIGVWRLVLCLGVSIVLWFIHVA